jgi:hypothetical protein
MVGQLPLEQHIGVRIPGGQPVDPNSLIGDLFGSCFGHCGNFCGHRELEVEQDDLRRAMRYLEE